MFYQCKDKLILFTI